MIVEAKDDTFESFISNGTGIVDFYSTHCGPCRALLPTLLTIENQMPFLTLIKVNTDFCPQTAEKYKIEALPTIYLYSNGVMTEYIGSTELIDLQKAIGKIIYGEDE